MIVEITNQYLWDYENITFIFRANPNQFYNLPDEVALQILGAGLGVRRYSQHLSIDIERMLAA